MPRGVLAGTTSKRRAGRIQNVSTPPCKNLDAYRERLGTPRETIRARAGVQDRHCRAQQDAQRCGLAMKHHVQNLPSALKPTNRQWKNHIFTTWCSCIVAEC